MFYILNVLDLVIDYYFNFMLTFSHLLLVYITFLVFGALVFHGLSSYEEKKRHIQINHQIHAFLYRNRKCLTGECKKKILFIELHIFL